MTPDHRLADLRAWLASRPHVEWCTCKACREKKGMPEPENLPPLAPERPAPPPA